MKNIIERMLKSNDEIISTNTTNNKFHTARMKKQDEKIEELRLSDFNQKKKLAVLNKKLSMHNRFIMALSEKRYSKTRTTDRRLC